MSDASDISVEVRKPGRRMSAWIASGRPDAAFLCQLIVGRQRGAGLRLKRRLLLGRATEAYRHGADNATQRMPQGYRKTIIA